MKSCPSFHEVSPIPTAEDLVILLQYTPLGDLHELSLILSPKLNIYILGGTNIVLNLVPHISSGIICLILSDFVTVLLHILTKYM